MFGCPAIRKWKRGHPKYSTGDITNRGYQRATIPCGTKICSLVLLRICAGTTVVWCFTGVHFRFSLKIFTDIQGALEKSADEKVGRRDWRKSRNWDFHYMCSLCNVHVKMKWRSIRNGKICRILQRIKRVCRILLHGSEIATPLVEIEVVGCICGLLKWVSQT
jgi:hypothetical protein